jgi:hypothetical protein
VGLRRLEATVLNLQFQRAQHPPDTGLVSRSVPVRWSILPAPRLPRLWRPNTMPSPGIVRPRPRPRMVSSGSIIFRRIHTICPVTASGFGVFSEGVTIRTGVPVPVKVTLALAGAKSSVTVEAAGSQSVGRRLEICCGSSAQLRLSLNPRNTVAELSIPLAATVQTEQRRKS